MEIKINLVLFIELDILLKNIAENLKYILIYFN